MLGKDPDFYREYPALLSGGDPSVSIPSLSSPWPSSLYLTDTSDTLEEPLASSPTTQQFVEETLARGFPLIPFHYTSSKYGGRSSCRLHLTPQVNEKFVKKKNFPRKGLR